MLSECSKEETMADSHVLTPETDDDTVTAEPTKSFFVDMLVRDVALIPAVTDLVDNAIDAARQIRPGGDYSGLHITVEASSDHFRITDNCGGMDLDVARHYAFRFGRDPSRAVNPRTIGQFGVGMKRTLFKIGRTFSVEAATATNSFLLEVNVEDWLKDSVWAFKLTRKSEHDERPQSETFTKVEVRGLYQDVASDMGDSDWIPRLADELRQKHRQSIDAGLLLVVGGSELSVEPLDVRMGDGIQPLREDFNYPVGADVVKAQMVCGVGPSSEDASGWYVFCNGRMILGADTTSRSGWGLRLPGRQRLPRWHSQYGRFRGYLLLECENSTSLPWNTTKTALDEDSPIWRDCLGRMASVTRQVINYLNDFDRAQFGANEIEDEDAREAMQGVIERVDSAEVRSLTEALATPSSSFTMPALSLGDLPEALARISYKRPVSEIEEIKNLLQVSTNVEVGHRTFNYYMEAEGR